MTSKVLRSYNKRALERQSIDREVKKMEKMTKKEMFTFIKSKMADNAEVVAFIDHELELLERKNSAERKPTVNQLDNKKIKKVVLEKIGTNSYTITEIIKNVLANTEWADLTCSRMTAIATQMAEDGDLIREVVKRKAYYKKA